MDKNHAFTTILSKDNEKITLSVDDKEVLFESADEQNSVIYPRSAMAALVFENNVKAFEQQGYISESHCAETLPGVLTIFPEDDDRSWISFQDDHLKQVCIYDADPVSVWDDLSPSLQKVKKLGYFQPEKADPGLLGIHLMRRFIAHPASVQCEELALELLVKIPEMLDLLAASSRADRLTQLIIYDFWNSVSPLTYARQLSLKFSRLKRLSLPYWAFSMFVSGVFNELECLVLNPDPQWISDKQSFLQRLPLEQVLDSLQESMPVLKNLAFPSYGFDGIELERLAKHPFVQQLEILDLFNVHQKFDYEALLHLRPQFQHLKYIIVGSHLSDKKKIQNFSDWPQVLFVPYNRQNSQLAKIDECWVFSEKTLE